MAYEYEGKFISLLDRLDEEERYFIFRGIDDELKEVYAKAKAFDEISDVIKKEDFYDRDTALNIIEIVDELEGLI